MQYFNIWKDVVALRGCIVIIALPTFLRELEKNYNVNIKLICVRQRQSYLDSLNRNFFFKPFSHIWSFCPTTRKFKEYEAIFVTQDLAELIQNLLISLGFNTLYSHITTIPCQKQRSFVLYVLVRKPLEYYRARFYKKGITFLVCVNFDNVQLSYNTTLFI